MILADWSLHRTVLIAIYVEYRMDEFIDAKAQVCDCQRYRPNEEGLVSRGDFNNGALGFPAMLLFDRVIYSYQAFVRFSL